MNIFFLVIIIDAINIKIKKLNILSKISSKSYEEDY